MEDNFYSDFFLEIFVLSLILINNLYIFLITDCEFEEHCLTEESQSLSPPPIKICNQSTVNNSTKANEGMNNLKLEFIESAHGYLKILCDNHIYVRNNNRNNITYWRCMHSKRLKCRARISTSLEKLISANIEHNHCPMKRLVYGMGTNKKRNLSRNKIINI